LAFFMPSGSRKSMDDSAAYAHPLAGWAIRLRLLFPLWDAPGDSITTKRILLFAQFREMIPMPHCELQRTPSQSPRRQFALIRRGLAVLWNLYGRFPTRWQWTEISLFRFVFTIAPEAPCTRAG
jgi:hypothetical protein